MIDKTELHIAEDDLPLAFLELDDETLGKFARSYLIQMEKSVHAHAGRKSMPIHLAMSMHGAIALYRMAARSNAAELTLHHEGVVWNGEVHGDWSITIKRDARPEIEANGK